MSLEADAVIEPSREDLIAIIAELAEALDGLVSLGRKDTSNPKYDDYYESARRVLAKPGVLND